MVFYGNIDIYWYPTHFQVVFWQSGSESLEGPKSASGQQRTKNIKNSFWENSDSEQQTQKPQHKNLTRLSIQFEAKILQIPVGSTAGSRHCLSCPDSVTTTTIYRALSMFGINGYPWVSPTIYGVSGYIIGKWKIFPKDSMWLLW
jgi:hypothetical protein